MWPRPPHLTPAIQPTHDFGAQQAWPSPRSDRTRHRPRTHRPRTIRQLHDGCERPAGYDTAYVLTRPSAAVTASLVPSCENANP